MLSVGMLNVIMLSVIILSAMANEYKRRAIRLHLPIRNIRSAIQ